MNENNLDLGNMKSRDIGNMISKTLVELGKEEVGNIDYGDLPSRALPELGKQVVKTEISHL